MTALNTIIPVAVPTAPVGVPAASPAWGETVRFAPARRAEADKVSCLTNQIFQLVSRSLDGPKGIDPASFIAAFGALAGYSARWIVHRQIAAGHLADDFATPRGIRRPGVVVSAHVDRHVHDMTGPSFASTFVPCMLASGADWLPQVNAMIQHNFMAIDSPRYPDYTVADRFIPQIPPQTLLMMLWQSTVTCLQATEGAETLAQAALAEAAVKAAKMYAGKVPLAVSGQLALETAIAMSKLDYGF
ncbi:MULTISPECIES: hypothetical protein [unclassified Roseitalea]|uniref:hypothetical protein n=1 Tax=unclassified Roseitalea TaxID=2639107 RepID=UPI00273FBBA6|nr:MULTISPECIES: hypothetical protein [unclassified Roseitalea]